MAVLTCPQMEDYIAGLDCLENFAGVSSVVYVGFKDELAEAMKETEGTYSTPTFKPGKGLYKLECKEEVNNVKGSSLGRRKGFKISVNFVLEAMNEKTSKIGRALNNRDPFFIIPDGETNQIIYDPFRKTVIEEGGIASDTGAAAADERTTNITATIGPVKYDHLHVTAPLEGGWDSLLASKAAMEP